MTIAEFVVWSETRLGNAVRHVKEASANKVDNLASHRNIALLTIAKANLQWERKILSRIYRYFREPDHNADKSTLRDFPMPTHSPLIPQALYIAGRDANFLSDLSTSTSPLLTTYGVPADSDAGTAGAVFNNGSINTFTDVISKVLYDGMSIPACSLSLQSICSTMVGSYQGTVSSSIYLGISSALISFTNKTKYTYSGVSPAERSHMMQTSMSNIARVMWLASENPKCYEELDKAASALIKKHDKPAKRSKP